MMKIGKIPVKHTYKPARIISDVLSAIIAAVILIATLNFFPLYKRTVNQLGNADFQFVRKYGYWLIYRQYIAWIFPALVVGIFTAYVILVLKNHKFSRFKITKENAQDVYDWYAFAVSLCKLPLLMCVFEVMYSAHQILLFNKASLFSLQLLLYAVLFVIIIRMSVHRINALIKMKAPQKSEDSGGVKAKIADDDS